MNDLGQAIETPPDQKQIEQKAAGETRLLKIGGIILIVAALAILFTMNARRSVDTENQELTTWGGAGSIRTYLNRIAENAPARISPQELISRQARDEQILIPTNTQDLSQDQTLYDQETDLVSLLAQLVSPSSGQTHDTSGLDSVYGFIPQGLISTSQPATKKTAFQQELFEYGNALGSALVSFEDAHYNMASVLKDAREDRNNQGKVEAAVRIAEDYTRLGEELSSMTSVPESARTFHDAFAQAHVDVGTYLEPVVKARSDEAMLEAIDEYNKRVETYTQKYYAMASFFASAQVVFREGDPGSIFTFSGSVSQF